MNREKLGIHIPQRKSLLKTPPVTATAAPRSERRGSAESTGNRRRTPQTPLPPSPITRQSPPRPRASGGIPARPTPPRPNTGRSFSPGQPTSPSPRVPAPAASTVAHAEHILPPHPPTDPPLHSSLVRTPRGPAPLAGTVQRQVPCLRTIQGRDASGPRGLQL